MRQILEVCSDVIFEAWRELKRVRLRTYLSILGIMIGSMGFTILICTLHLENALRNEQDNNTIDISMPNLDDYNNSIFQRKPRLKRYQLVPADGEAIEKDCQSVEQVFITGSQQVDFKGKNWQRGGLRSTNITRVDRFPGELAWGRIFTPTDMTTSAHVAVVDQMLSNKLWPHSPGAPVSEPATRYLHINGIKFEIVGVLRHDIGNTATAYIPYTSMQGLFWDANWIIRATAKRGHRKAAAKQIDEILFNRIGDPGCSFVKLPGMSYEELKIYTFFGIIGILMFMSAGLAVSNKAYIDALERVQQFAIRRALGASRQRIYAIVLMESSLICGFGCFYGGLIGWMIFASFSAWKWIERDARNAIPVLPLGAMFICVIMIGIVSSLQGAAIAANANPAEVLTRKDVV